MLYETVQCFSDLHLKIYWLSKEQCCCSEGIYAAYVSDFIVKLSFPSIFMYFFWADAAAGWHFTSAVTVRLSSATVEHGQPHCRGLTSLPQNKSWHHRWADTAPLVQLWLHGAGSLRSCDICALGSCWFAYKAREDSASPPSSPICRRSLHLSLLCTPSSAILLMEAQIILPLSLPFPLHLSRPVLTHQRQCTAYSLPAAAMETGVVVYDSARLVCREIDRKRDTQRWEKTD